MSTFKVTRPLYSPPCWRVRPLQRWAGMETCWPWETAATMPSARPREALRRPQGRRGAGHVVATAHPQFVYFLMCLWPPLGHRWLWIRIWDLCCFDRTWLTDRQTWLFLSRVSVHSMHSAILYVLPLLSVRPSVRPSVQCRDCIVSKRMHISSRTFSCSGRSIILVFWIPPQLQNSNKGSLNTPAWENVRFSTEIAVYFRKEASNLKFTMFHILYANGF